ncbi:hypothetical protein BKH46_02695 [Helicobacter sp. 12S02634-8]|uniref:hypothetical protein n=1 Tax=Helicobacter sp. 12S02634-8 TaxID=1476199 RepID=UPI000BA511BE|nr:hypothetical protein [Helicobacter sp. 12S02634-8]PAF47764.1 hypothetical protein BKH46_02695 [Helicobacter sp. 12S02634-8]
MPPNPAPHSIEEINKLLDVATQKAHIDAALNALLNLSDFPHQLKDPAYKKTCQQLLELFQDKIYHLVLKKGDILERAYLCLFALTNTDTQIDPRFNPFIELSDKHLFTPTISDEENIMLLELGAIARILSGQRTAGLQGYIKNICLIDMRTPSAHKAADFIIKAFTLLEIPFQTCINALKEVLAPEYFFSLNPTQQRSIFNWQLQVFWNIKHFFNHRDWIGLYPFWEKIFYTLLENPNAQKIDAALYVQFFIYHMCGNSFTSQNNWREFNQKITQKASSVYEKFTQDFGLTQAIHTPKPKKIIGFLRDRFVENSPYKVEYSFLKTLVQNEYFQKHYEIRIYLMGFLEKSNDDPLIKSSYEALGIPIVDVIAPINQEGYYNSHLSKALSIRESIIKDGVDILISPNNGYGISDFILASRSAPKQVFWSHGNFVYDSPYLDLKITHICSQSGPLDCEGYPFMGVSVGMEPRFYNPPIPAEIIKNERAKYPKGTILGLIGRLTKIDSLPYLQCIIQIMQDFPDSIFLACGVGNVYEIQQKISAINPAITERFFFPGYVDSSLYGHIIDFWPDSFPMEQGESKVEFNAKGGLILTLSKEGKEARLHRLEKWFAAQKQALEVAQQQENISAEFLREIWIEDTSCIAFDPKDYHQKAIALLNLTPKAKQRLIEQRSLIRKIYDNIRKQSSINSFLKAIQNA